MPSTKEKEKINDLPVILLKEARGTCLTEYEDAQKTFTNLDTKAQNTTAIAGIFLAGALAFINGDAIQKIVRMGKPVVILLLATIILSLMATTILCLYGMRIRQITMPDSSPSTEEIDEILEGEASEWPERHQNYLRGQIIYWQCLTDDLYNANQNKAKAVIRGQSALSIAILTAAVLFLFILAGAWYSASHP